jgi:Sugar (and other) transporter
MLGWLFNFVVVMITPIGLKTLNYKFYIIWAVTDLAFMFIVYLFYPETARKSLEEIDLLFLKESEKDIKKEDEKVEG